MAEGVDVTHVFAVAEALTGSRDTARSLLGERYAEKVQLWREVIRACQNKINGSVVAAVSDCISELEKRHGGADGFSVLMLCAAACEELDDPSIGDT